MFALIGHSIWHETLQERSLSRMAFRGSALPCGVEHKYKLAIVDYFDGGFYFFKLVLPVGVLFSPSLSCCERFVLLC
ncbi:hypothetical protein HYC85_015684 [Camellia sinensis]|uniref:Uncharacterized protein n=1 Tax=Camellia sinensis TaxID=4442 RepID=A0A7J7H164_CAMSI|nr:hypothetical protein HYC85_015684 [Camellia sinensis]